MKKLLTLYILGLFMYASASSAEDFYALSAVKINGETLNFSELKGKKLMIVNTASLCGYTYQYSELQQLYSLYGGQNFEIIGFPANNFGNQEPGSNEDIEDFCTENYGVTFTMMQKISVLGSNMHPVYQWLTKKAKNGVLESSVQWNFQKYLINADGTFRAVIGTQTSPLAQTIKDWLDEPVSVETTLNNDKLLINHFGNQLLIQTPEKLENIIKIELYDINGSQVKIYDNPNIAGNEIILQTDGLITGKYFVVLKTINKVLTGGFTFIE